MRTAIAALNFCSDVDSAYMNAYVDSDNLIRRVVVGL